VPSPNPSLRTRVSRACLPRRKSPPRCRRSVGAVIVDICRDLGVAPGDLDRAFWAEINLAIILHGGSAVRLQTPAQADVDFALGNLSDEADPEWPAPPSLSPAPTTGPPPEVLAAAD
jgi:hypothetical protein